MTTTRIHLTEEAPVRTLITAAASMVSVRVLRGYGLELALFETMSPRSPAKVIYRDLNPARAVAVKGPMSEVSYTLRRRHDVSEPFDVEVTYSEAGAAGA